MQDCIFCRIIKGELPSKKVYEDDKVLAFYDIKPSAPIHVLVIPKKHITSAITIEDEDKELLAHLFKTIKEVARLLGVDKSGFRLVSNIGHDAGQSVLHLHFHILAGKIFGPDFG